MLRAVAATKNHVRTIMRKLSLVSAGELENGNLDINLITTMMISLCDQIPGHVLMDRNVPIAVLFVTPLGDGTLSTAFMATEGFFGGRSRPTIFLRRLLEKRLAELPPMPVKSRTFSSHPEVDRWYRAMGYDPFPLVEGPSQTYTRQPRSP